MTMITKILAPVFFLFHFGSCGLLKTPKVYNALITTDENITPSQSYPVIQPHIHETGIAYPAYSIGGYSHFGAHVFDPARYSPYIGPKFINPGLLGRHNGIPLAAPPAYQSNNNNGNQNGESEESGENKENESNDNKNPESNEGQQPPQPESLEQNHSPKSPQSINKPPIPLNEFGLPPNLIPINSYNFNYNPNPSSINLAPYPYNSYPLVYDQYAGYNQNPYLPPFGYYPQSPYDEVGSDTLPQTVNSGKRVKGLPKKSKMQTHDANEGNDSAANQTNGSNEKLNLQSKSQFIPPTAAAAAATVDIKNHANKDKNIPDVPPPPIPSGAKITQD